MSAQVVDYDQPPALDITTCTILFWLTKSWDNFIINDSFPVEVFFAHCYGRPLLQAWLLPDTIPNNCVGENSPLLSGYGTSFWCTSSLIRILPGSYISAMHLFICFLVMDFVRKSTISKGIFFRQKLYHCVGQYKSIRIKVYVLAV